MWTSSSWRSWTSSSKRPWTLSSGKSSRWSSLWRSVRWTSRGTSRGWTRSTGRRRSSFSSSSWRMEGLNSSRYCKPSRTAMLASSCRRRLQMPRIASRSSRGSRTRRRARSWRYRRTISRLPLRRSSAYPRSSPNWRGRPSIRNAGLRPSDTNSSRLMLRRRPWSGSLTPWKIMWSNRVSVRSKTSSLWLKNRLRLTVNLWQPTSKATLKLPKCTLWEMQGTRKSSKR